MISLLKILNENSLTTKVFKITFPTEKTWYGQKDDRKDANSFLNYMISNSKNPTLSDVKIYKEIRDTLNKNDIKCEVVWEGNKNEVSKVLENFIKNDINHINKFLHGKTTTSFSKNIIPIPSEEIFKTPNGIYLNKMYLDIKPELKKRINLKNYINKGTSIFYKIINTDSVKII